jgi:hypothetical protein
MEEVAGADWWESKVPQQIRENVRRLIRNEIENGIAQRSERAIDYTTFGEFGVIISSNWDSFEPVLTSQLAVQRIIKNLNLLRGPIAHCCPMSEEEVDRLALAVEDWFRLIG